MCWMMTLTLIYIDAMHFQRPETLISAKLMQLRRIDQCWLNLRSWSAAETCRHLLDGSQQSPARNSNIGHTDLAAWCKDVQRQTPWKESNRAVALHMANIIWRYMEIASWCFLFVYNWADLRLPRIELVETSLQRKDQVRVCKPSR